MATPSHFLKNIKSFFKIKIEFAIKWKRMSRNVGSTKWRLHWGSFRGSNLNLRWGRCSVWLVDQWVPTFLCACVCLTVDYTLRAFGIIILDACLVVVFVWGVGMLILLIDHFDFSSHMDILLIVWSLCSPWHVHSFCCLSRSSWHDWFSWWYIILIIIARYSSRLVCV